MNELVNWSPIQPFGAKVDLDLRTELSDAQIARLRELFDKHHILVFSNQSLSPDEQSRFCGLFGPLVRDEATYLTANSDMGEVGGGELAFHSDLSCTPQPLIAISLHAVEVDDRASPTQFVDAMGPVSDLPEKLRTQLDGLHIMNLWPIQLAERQRRENAPEGWPGTEHPVLKPHPRTGEPIMYLNASHSDRIVELEADQSESVIENLFQRLYDPANRYEHHWRKGDLVIWDNLALQHARPKVVPGATRKLQRVEVGSASYMDLMPPELLDYYMN